MNKKEKIMTVKEWSTETNLSFKDYDGYVDIYKNLLKIHGNGFIDSIAIRFDQAGNLYCNRRGFIAGIDNCCREFSSYEKLLKMVDIIPEFVESEIDQLISFKLKDINSCKRQKEMHQDFNDLLNLFKLKIVSRAKSLEFNSNRCESKLPSFDDNKYNGVINLLKTDGDSLEDIEKKIIEECLKRFEKLSIKSFMLKRRIPTDLLNTLLYLARFASRNIFSGDEEYMAISIPQETQDDFIRTFNICSKDSVEPIVAFKISGTGQGTLPITNEIEKKIGIHLKSKKSC